MPSNDKSFFTLFLRNKHLLVLTVIVIFVAGLSALLSMPQLEDPVITNRNPLIVTNFPGASAERVESLVTEKIEEELQEIAEIKEINSTSLAGISIVRLELADRVTGETNEQVFSKVRDKLGDAESRFPASAGKPFLDDKRGPVAYSLIVALAWEHDSPAQLGLLNRLSEDLADRLRTVSGTEIVRTFGEPEEEITVTVDDAELIALGLTAADVARITAAADAKVSAGAFRGLEADYLLEVAGELDSTQRIAQIPIRENVDGSLLRLSAVASVERDWRKPQTAIALSEGRRAVFVAARVEKTRRIDLWARDASSIVAGFSSEIGPGIAIDTVFDQNHYTAERLGELGFNLFLGGLVIVAVVILTMGWRASLLIGSALPLTAAATVFWVAFAGGTLHQMSIFGMMIALGLLIDNAIVVVDDVRKQLALGKDPTDAVASTLRHLLVPLFSSTLTTVLAFMPILLLPGDVGDFVKSIGSSVIIALVSSFAIAMTIMASLAGLYGREKDRKNDAFHVWWRDGIRINALSNFVRRALQAGLRRPFAGLAVASSLPVIGFLSATTLGSQFFPRVDRDMFEVEVWLPTEASITATRAVATEIESALTANPEINEVHWLVGGSFPSVYYNLVMTEDDASHYAHGIVVAESAKEVKRLIPKIQRELDQQFRDAQIVVRQFGQGPPSDADVEFRLYGADIATLQDLADQIRPALAEHSGTLHTRVSMPRGEPKLWFDADEDEARLAGLTLGDTARQLEANLEGITGGSVVEDLEELPVRIKLDDSRRASLADIASTNFTNGGPDWTPLSALGELNLRPERGGITRRNGRRVNTLQAFTANSALPIDVANEVLALLDEQGFSLPAGYRLELGGDSESQAEAIGNLMIYLPVLLTLTVATIILAFRSVRLAGLLGGVAGLSVGLGLLSTWAYGFPISFNTILGTAGLIGLALNDSIVVLAAIRASPAASTGDISSIVETVMGATRHLVSTTVTTIGGFLPLLVFVGGEFWPPLAIVLAGGVAGATLLAMLFIPAGYVLLHRPKAIEASRSAATLNLSIATTGAEI